VRGGARKANTALEEERTKPKKRGSKGGVNSGAKRKKSADRKYGRRACKLAKSIWNENPEFSQPDLITEMKNQWPFKTTYGQSMLPKLIPSWIGKGRLVRPIKVTKNVRVTKPLR
jgi:hypothetical protein